ncbi:MAG: VWA domain-containing protein [Acidobacteriota bacterium]|nr:VWA domain-containing protein [Acidobacteriota bacterium]
MRMTPPRSVLLLTALLAAASLRASGQEKPVPPPAGQEKPAAEPPPAQTPAAPDGGQPVFRTGINFIRVDATVTDRQGNPVDDLTLEDFEISEDGKPQKPETLRLVKIDPAVAPSYTQRTIRTRLDEETAAADETSRIFVFFLDDYAVRRESSMSVRRPLIEFITNELAPNDLVSVMYPLTPIDAVTLTRNHQGVINTIEKFEGRKYNYDPINDLERQYVYKLTPDAIERLRRQVSLTAIRGISTKLGSLREGRKSLILVSEGYSALLPPQLRSDQPGGFGDPGRATRDPFAADNNLMEDRVQFSASLDLLQELEDVFAAANRNNTSIYAVDPRGLSTGEFDISTNISGTTSQRFLNNSMDSLRSLAENTDGRAIVNRNDLGTAMKQIVRDASAYYLIGYTSSQAPMDGKFHEIRVRVKRPGVQVRARKGYWAYTEADARRAEAGPRAGPPVAVTRALSTLAPLTNRRYVRTWIGTERGANGLAKVTFLWEPMPPTPGVRRDEARRVTLLATTANGDIVYRGRVPSTLAPTGAGAVISFDAKPGKLDLRLTIEGDGTGMLDTEHRELIVPDLTAPELTLGTPKVWFARNAREFTALASGTGTPPTAIREFRRTDRLLIRVDAFAPGTAPATVTAALLNQAGAKMSDVVVAQPAAAGEPYTIDFSLASYAAGQYLLELTANSEGHQPVSELVAFRLTS